MKPKVYLVKKSADFVIPDMRLVDFMVLNFDLVIDPAEADYVLVFGGDGTMIRHGIRKFWQITNYLGRELIFTGMNYGHVGFLLNDPPSIGILKEIIEEKVKTHHPRLLEATLYDKSGEIIGKANAVNDFWFERSTKETAKIRVTVEGKVYRERLVCDGMIVASPIGSTAYNLAAKGPALPLEAELMVLTGICPSPYSNWGNAILPPNTVVILEALETDFAPVRFLMDGDEIHQVAKAVISLSQQTVTIAFAESQDFRQRVLRLQIREPIKE